MVNFDRFATALSDARVFMRSAVREEPSFAGKAVSQAFRNGVANRHMWSRVVLPATFLFTFACGVLLAQDAAPAQSPGGQAVEKPAAAAMPPESLRVGPGDEVDIAVFGAPDFTTHTRVENDGTIAVPFLGPVKVGGLTSSEAQNAIRQRLLAANLVRDPQVGFYVKDYSSEGISISGEVAHPGFFSALGPHRLLDVIQLAGGTTASAGRKVIIAHRGRLQDADTVMLSSDPLLMAQDNVELQPGDTVIVSKAGLVYVLGEVGQPGAYTVDETHPPTVLKLIALAKGPTGGAALKRATILHQSPTGLSESRVLLQDILRARAADVPLHDDDILMIPGKHHFALSSGSVVQTLTTLAIYRGF